MKIPEQWTFQNASVAAGFDQHVREQLPWYDLATQLVAVIGRHYISHRSIVYDIGASTGNIGNALEQSIKHNRATLYAIEESREMAQQYKGPGILEIKNALEYSYQPHDLSIMFLVLMFIPYAKREAFLKRIYNLLNIGGAMIIMDKIEMPYGYSGSILRKMALAWKINAGVSADEILQKELSLSGYQRPITEKILPGEPVRFFQSGEFVGWLIEKR